MFANRFKMRTLITAGLALGLATLACSAPAGSGTTPTPETIASPTGEATAAPPTAEQATSGPSPVPQGPTATAGASPIPPTLPATNVPGAPTNTPPSGGGTADYEGISFFFAYAITSKWQVETVPQQPPGGPENWLIATHYKFSFPDYPVVNTQQPARVMVFPVSAWQDYNPAAVGRITALQKLLKDKPSTFGDNEEIPVLPVFNEAQMLRVHVSYFAFQNGSGVRFITQYAQSPMPVNNGGMFYTFQGLTSDGKYYVTAFFPITHPSLPANATNPDPAVNSDYLAYISGVKQSLEAASDNSFSPDLRTLDYMMGTLKVK